MGLLRRREDRSTEQVRTLQAAVSSLHDQVRDLRLRLQQQTQQHDSKVAALTAKSAESVADVTKHAQVSMQQQEQQHSTEIELLLAAQQTQNLEQLQTIQQLQEDKALLEHSNHALSQQVSAAQQNLRQLLTFQAEEEQQEHGSCKLSIAFDATNGRKDIERKYADAVQSFIQHVVADYIIKKQTIHQPQHCKFLLWVTFAGGRLPDEMPLFEEYAAMAGKEAEL